MRHRNPRSFTRHCKVGSWLKGLRAHDWLVMTKQLEALEADFIPHGALQGFCGGCIVEVHVSEDASRILYRPPLFSEFTLEHHSVWSCSDRGAAGTARSAGLVCVWMARLVRFSESSGCIRLVALRCECGHRHLAQAEYGYCLAHASTLDGRSFEWFEFPLCCAKPWYIG